MGLDNILVTPHHAGITIEANKNMAAGAAEQWITLLRGGVPPRLVNQMFGRITKIGLKELWGFDLPIYSKPNI